MNSYLQNLNAFLHLKIVRHISIGSAYIITGLATIIIVSRYGYDLSNLNYKPGMMLVLDIIVYLVVVLRFAKDAKAQSSTSKKLIANAILGFLTAYLFIKLGQDMTYYDAVHHVARQALTK